MKYGIEFRHLHYFTCVAEELHFSRAADKLGMAQAPLSQQIRQLEDRIGTRLLIRTTRSVKLTPAGEIFLRHALEILGGIDRAVTHTRSISGDNSGKIYVSGVHVALSHVLPGVIAEFHKKYPAVQVDVQLLGTASQLELLQSGKVQVAFIRQTNGAGFMKTEHLFKEGFVAVLPKHHRLADQRHVSVKDFAGEPIITYAPTIGASYHHVIMDAFRRAGIYPMVVQEVSHTLAIATLVAAGVGIAIAPSWLAHNLSPHLVYRPLAEIPDEVELVVGWQVNEKSKVVLDFVEFARAHVR
ncbi:MULTISPECIES: LysR family transcriptional regulator [Agrobacterium]|uniref:HTH-type transcriptional regulator TtuA n=1 Tax=Agrobacterium rosae TaxID=1972867 RepID=A0A1R3TMJ4_9HYPH|nr:MULTISPECIES: LysR substrate-binding domain-containing protein [Agrobacterium]KAA3515550.1 LysR family transcriptional regulator [Agrobacterium rosae]KAA3524515.1 LysR family transcriptional regulator [Agrobacterium rosae]MBN7804176.1 LysR family transcriptional regulator [Agrobacterium rosae]MCM2431431.1 LysR family transcriptional regulator [Agrobacterium rosae]MDX8302398.1 LysR substrate-binding domain-containing protein [Agrobacterium rosae]